MALASGPPPYSVDNVELTAATSSGWAVPADEQPTLRERLRYHKNRILPRLTFPAALVVFSAIFAGTTYALVAWVQHLVATAHVSSDPNVWMQVARTRDYDACYYGCTGDCDDTNYAWDACARTARANVTGLICDGNRMWNWKDRYPIECLRAVGEFYKADALAAVKQHYRNRLSIIILTFLGGLAGGVITYKVWWSRTRHMEQRNMGNHFVAANWPRVFSMTPWRMRKSTRIESRGKRLKMLLANFLALFGRGARAYACTGYGEVTDQYFVNDNRTILGVVHGWFSNCYDVELCTPTCTTLCSGGAGTDCSIFCSESCVTVIYSNRAPYNYVMDILPSVRACGFSLTNQIEGDVKTRVANAGIERTWWVKISVSGFNITDVQDTDDAIQCLHSIGDAGKP